MSKNTSSPVYSTALLELESQFETENERLAKLFSCDRVAVKRPIKRLSKSSILNEVKTFLPKLKTANDKLELAIANGADVNIENVEDDDNVIEMNVGLILYDEDSDSRDSCSGSDDSVSSTEHGDDAQQNSSKKRRLISELNE